MKKIYYFFCLFLFLNSCAIVKQKPSITKNALPEVCSNLHDDLVKNWSKHRKKKCHIAYANLFAFIEKDRECLDKLTKEQVIALFGEPDEIFNENIFSYIISKDCKDRSMLSYYLIQFNFGIRLKVERKVELIGRAIVS